jgi:hypothetical protein
MPNFLLKGVVNRKIEYNTAPSTPLLAGATAISYKVEVPKFL